MNKIRNYNLERWDNLSVEPGSNPYREPVSSMKKGMAGNSIKWIQFELNKHGYNLAEDGIFGNKTFNAVWDYQEKK
jgi:lysozyme family protein